MILSIPVFPSNSLHVPRHGHLSPVCPIPSYLPPFLDDLQSPVSDAHVSTDEGCPLKQWEICHGSHDQQRPVLSLPSIVYCSGQLDSCAVPCGFTTVFPTVWQDHQNFDRCFSNCQMALETMDILQILILIIHERNLYSHLFVSIIFLHFIVF